jgi:arginyl-tRNA synthetase
MKNYFFKNLVIRWKKIAHKYNIKWKKNFIQWDLPEKISADFSLNLALSIAHQTKQSPQSIAKEIISWSSIIHSELEWTITEQGYINFRFPLTFYQQFLVETWKTEGLSLRGEKKDVCLNIEYVSANPTGYLHLAHFRHAFIGNTLANVYQFCGYEVIREYYINDRGSQLSSLINSVYYFYHKLQGASFPIELGKIEYGGKSSQEVAEKLIKKWGDKYLNKKLSKRDLEIWKKEVLELILAKIRQDLEKCGIKFDVWFSETSLYEKKQHLDLIQELQEKNLIYSQEGATFFRSSLGGDDKDRVIIKQDSDYTYFFSDILYHRDKLKRADKLINIMGGDHHGYISRIKSVCQLLGHQPEYIQIVLVQIVNLFTKDGSERFSKRVGNTIELEEALKYLELDQLKFFLLEKEPNQPLSINAELLKENKEKTRLYYIQYAHARCHQIFQKGQAKGITKISSNIDLLTNPAERKIVNLLVRFFSVLENIVEESETSQNKPHHLFHYLDELAQVWQIYYQNCTILEAENLELTSQKLLLVKNIQIVLKTGLEIMGIEAPKRM